MSKIKELFKKNIVFTGVLIALGVALFGLYLSVFFTRGVEYEETFLKKEVVSSETHYKGKNLWGELHIIVKALDDTQDNFQVSYRLPNTIHRQFTVNFTEESAALRGVKIWENGDKLLFEGMNQKESPFLFTKSGEPYIEWIDVVISGRNPYQADYKIDLKNVVNFATFEGEAVRGDVGFLLGAVFLILLTAFDIRFPLFFFKMKYMWNVENPEPSDFFITMQRISWYLYPIIAFILLIVALF